MDKLGIFFANQTSICILLSMFPVCLVFLSVHCSLVVTCWESADLLALLYVMFYFFFVTFPCGVLVQVWCWIELIPDFCFFLSLIHI